MTIPGIDLVEICEVADSLDRFGDRYLRRILTDRERAGLEELSPARRSTRVAGLFAAKEAVFKALRMPADVGMAWTAIEITSPDDAPPGVRLHASARHWAHLSGVESVQVSISHDTGRAVAMAIAHSGDAPSDAPGTQRTIPQEER